MPPGAIPFPFGDCRICKDKATGLHYGVATCEGCKGFFKRSIPKGDKYKCFFGGQCVITPQNRNRCKSCRYRKCLSLGMSFEAVKMGRIPKVEKQRALNATRVLDSGWKELKNSDSPDSGIEEENNRQMFWSQGRQEEPPHTQPPFPSFPSSYHQLPFSSSPTTSTCTSSNLDPVPSSSLHPVYTMTPSSGISDSRCENPNMVFDHSMPHFHQEKSNMSLLAEAALLPNGQISSGDDSTGAESSSSRSRSMYSSNVIKVLFNQVVEMTDTKKVPEMMEKLAKKCPGNNGVDLLKSLSCETFFDGDKKPLEETDHLTSHHSTWPSKNEQKIIEHFDKTGFEEIGGLVPHRQTSRHFQDVHQDVPVGEIASDMIPFYKEEPGIFPVDEDSYHVPHPPNRYSCSENLYSNSQERSGLQEEMWQNRNFKSDNDIKMLDPHKVTHTEKEKVAPHSRDIILDDLETGTEHLFENVVLVLQNALDKHHEQVRESSAFAKAFREKEVPIKKVEITEENMKETWNQLFLSLTENNNRIIGFCGDVPGFLKLNPDDQKILMKRAYYDIWMLTASEFFVDGESYLRLPNGSFYSRQWMEYVIGIQNVKLLFDFAESFNRLTLTELEISIIAAIELTSPGHVDIDLKDAQAIQKLNSLYLDLLVHVITKRNPDNSSRILVDIFRLLPKLAEINKMQQDLIANFSKDKPPS